jgi:hypothetical protein
MQLVVGQGRVWSGGDDGHRAEEVAQRMEWEGAQAGASGGVDESSSEGAGVEVAAERRREHRVLVAGLEFAVGEAGEALCHFVDHGNDADLARLRGRDLSIGTGSP